MTEETTLPNAPIPAGCDAATGSAFTAGEWVVWLHVPRGGYGYTIRVPARVDKVGPSRVRIAAKLKDGSEKMVSVKPANLLKLARPQNDQAQLPPGDGTT